MRWSVAFTALLSCGAHAQSGSFWAIPVPGPAVEIREEPDTTSAVLVRVTADDPLLVRTEGTNWYWAQDARGKQGYLPRSVVRPMTELSDSNAVHWMHTVFQEEARLGRLILERYSADDSLGTQAAGRALGDHEYERNAALALFTPYFCRTGNTSLLRSMMESVAANPGSASEEPPYRLTLALECRPTEFKRALASMDNQAAHEVRNATQNGLWLRFNEADPVQVKQRDALQHTLHE